VLEKTVEAIEPEPEEETAAAEIVEEPTVKTVSKKDLAKIEEIQKIWGDAMKHIRERNNSLGVFLRNARPLEISDGLLTLEVYYQFHKDLVEEPKNSELIAATIENLLGRPVRIIGKVGVRDSKKDTAKVETSQEIDPSEIFGKLN
jgi:hypothetical protein